MMPGDVFGELTIMYEERVPNTPGRVRAGFKSGARGYRCLCSCGVETVAPVSSLSSGIKRSCGHLKLVSANKNIQKASRGNVTHGLSKHDLYPTWSGMMTRCYDESHRYYRRYGARGIMVCDRWHSVEYFISDIERILGPRPEKHSLDRVDNDGGFTPSNVRWATQSEQILNSDQYSSRGYSLGSVPEMVELRNSGMSLREVGEVFGIGFASVWKATTGNPNLLSTQTSRLNKGIK